LTVSKKNDKIRLSY